jgi:dUTP pyrophosphatase
MENSNQMGLDPNMYEQILKQFEKIKTEAGIEPDENYDHELEDLLGMGFDDLEEEIYKSAMMRTIEVETIHPDAVFPKYAYPSDSGFDLHSTQELTIGPFGRILVPTGLKVSFPKGYEIQVRPKSGLAIKQGLTVLNTPGTVDQGYTGEIQVIVFNTTKENVKIKKGQKIAQGVLCPVVSGKWIRMKQTEKIKEKDRNDNGFGSTGI